MAWPPTPQTATHGETMILTFSPDLSQQRIAAHGVELAQIMGLDRDAHGQRIQSWPLSEARPVASFADPVLVTDSYRIGQLDPTTRDTVFALYACPLRVVRYKQTEIQFEQRRYPGVWGPSIDTLLFCHALEQAQLSGVRSAAEAGAGSGFIAMHVLQMLPRLEDMLLVDLNPKAVGCCRDHCRDERARFAAGDAREALAGQRWDLIVCNPPYIPRRASIEDNPYEGVGLLAHLVQNAGRLLQPGGRIVTNVSSLCERAFQALVEQHGVDCKTLAELTVPLKVYNVLNNASWLAYLREHGGLLEHAGPGYDCWQRLRVVEVVV